MPVDDPVPKTHEDGGVSVSMADDQEPAVADSPAQRSDGLAAKLFSPVCEGEDHGANNIEPDGLQPEYVGCPEVEIVPLAGELPGSGMKEGHAVDIHARLEDPARGRNDLAFDIALENQVVRTHPVAPHVGIHDPVATPGLAPIAFRQECNTPAGSLHPHELELGVEIAPMDVYPETRRHGVIQFQRRYCA